MLCSRQDDRWNKILGRLCRQSGLTQYFIIIIAIWRSGILHAATCHHLRAVEYFTASIRQDCLFPALPCSSWNDFEKGKCLKKFRVRDISLMGMQAEQCNEQEEPMYLTTMSKSPFCGMENHSTFGFISLTPPEQISEHMGPEFGT